MTNSGSSPGLVVDDGNDEDEESSIAAAAVVAVVVAAARDTRTAPPRAEAWYPTSAAEPFDALPD